MGLLVTELGELFLIFILLLTEISFILLEEDGSRVSNVETKDFFLEDEDCYEGASS